LSITSVGIRVNHLEFVLDRTRGAILQYHIQSTIYFLNMTIGSRWYFLPSSLVIWIC